MRDHNDPKQSQPPAHFSRHWRRANLSKAAKRLHITQPAVSHALNNLRHEFEDELFVRGSNGMVATPRGLELIALVRSRLTPLQDIYQFSSPSLSQFQGTVTIASTTYFEIQIIKELSDFLRVTSPQAKLSFLPLTGEVPRIDLEQGRIDLAMAAYFADLPEGLRSVQVFNEDHVCVTAVNHPFLNAKDKLKTYLESSHLKIDVPPGSIPLVDQELRRLGHQRTIGLYISNFMTPPIPLESSQLILTCPKSLGEQYCRFYNLRLSEPPIKIPPLQVTMGLARTLPRSTYTQSDSGVNRQDLQANQGTIEI